MAPNKRIVNRDTDTITENLIFRRTMDFDVRQASLRDHQASVRRTINTDVLPISMSTCALNRLKGNARDCENELDGENGLSTTDVCLSRRGYE